MGLGPARQRGLNGPIATRFCPGQLVLILHAHAAEIFGQYQQFCALCRSLCDQCFGTSQVVLNIRG